MVHGFDTASRPGYDKTGTPIQSSGACSQGEISRQEAITITEEHFSIKYQNYQGIGLICFNQLFNPDKRPIRIKITQLSTFNLRVMLLFPRACDVKHGFPILLFFFIHIIVFTIVLIYILLALKSLSIQMHRSSCMELRRYPKARY